ncbi:MAG: nuclear transport factor 2 family protein [Sneathiella sp.]
MIENEFIWSLYETVDQKNAQRLSNFLGENVRFRLGNYPAVTGKKDVIDVNDTFFRSIDSMSHQIDGFWSVGNTLICNGSVDYTRLDGSSYSAAFATILQMEQGKIVDYLVYADLSGL